MTALRRAVLCWRASSRISLGVAAMAAMIARTPRAQEIEPRAYAATPVGALFTGVALGYTTGGVVFEPTSPFTDVRAHVTTGSLAVGGTFGFFGRTASAAIGLPYAWAKISGNVFEEAQSVKRVGLADARLRLAVGLLGGRAMSLQEFARRKPSTYVGTSVTIAIPTGQYYSDKLINVGPNRWAFKPEIGASKPFGPWTVEFYAGAWLFTRNSSFFPDQTKTQDPLMSVQSHVGYTFRPRLWIAGNVVFYAGGRAVIDDVPAERQENTRVGLTASVPVAQSHAVRLAWSRGAITRVGSSFVTWSVAWQTTMIRRRG